MTTPFPTLSDSPNISLNLISLINSLKFSLKLTLPVDSLSLLIFDISPLISILDKKFLKLFPNIL